MNEENKLPELHTEQVRIRGVDTEVPAVQIHDRTIIRTGSWLKTAKLFDEELVEGEPVGDPIAFVAQLRASGLGADIFTFTEEPTQCLPKHSFYWEEDNVAVIRTNSFTDWWEKSLPQESRKNVRRAAKRDVVVKEAVFDDSFVHGIKDIYDETPVRQGRKFWHYGKTLEAVKRENSTYLERSWFVGAYHMSELIGFIKVIMVGNMAALIQILAKDSHRDRRPMNALLAHTVQLCEERGASFLVYGKFRYGRKEGDSLGEFKKRNGFEELRFPRYYVPLTLRGRMAIKLGAHLGAANMIPPSVAAFLLKLRAWFLGTRSKAVTNSPVATESN